MLQDIFNSRTMEIISDVCMDGIIAIDKSEKIVYMNETYLDYFGYTQEEVLGKHVTEIIKNTELPRVLRTGEKDYNVVHLMHDEQKTKGEKLVYVNRGPIFEDGEIIGAIGYVKLYDTTQEIYNSYSVMMERVEYYKTQLKKYSLDHSELDRIVGNSPKITAVKKVVKRVSGSDFSVLLMGETGTGKDLIANALHYMSPRSLMPFVKINCAALPHNLIESELFGYAEGAFTGAQKGGKPGKFEVADGGTLFLDEIGELPLSMQAKLLRVLQDGEFERIGDNKLTKVNVRIIAATNQNLEQKIKDKEFRSDLFYRLNVIQIVLPPLRERKEDIPDIIHIFLDRLNKTHNTNVQVDPSAVEMISGMYLAGNVRELKNIIDRCYILCENNRINSSEVERIINPIMENDTQGSLVDSVNFNEKNIILEALSSCNNNITKAAEQLGIHRMTLYRKMKKYDIQLENEQSKNGLR